MSDAKGIQCPCGYTLHGEGDTEVVLGAQQHPQHPRSGAELGPDPRHGPTGVARRSAPEGRDPR